jgi:hypothetical protein
MAGFVSASDIKSEDSLEKVLSFSVPVCAECFRKELLPQIAIVASVVIPEEM